MSLQRCKNTISNMQAWSYDNLNQITASPSANYEHDLSGNRIWKNRYVQGSGVRYTWDILNRMLSCSNTQSGAKYTYRADGLRTEKVEGLTLSWTPPATTAGMNQQTASSGYYDSMQSVNLPTTRYYYDGQSGFEEDYTVLGGGVPVTTVCRNALGARGIDAVYTQVGQQSETAGYMLYDGHGNVTATLARNGSSFIVSNERLFDAWGNVRSGSTSGAPRQRHVGNLGHVQDDESGLIYMRARYYEPTTGRFVSEDAGRQGGNWYSYCGNSPTGRADKTGSEYEDDSFDPIYQFDLAKWWTTYRINAISLPIRIIIATYFKGELGYIAAIVMSGVTTGYLGASIVEMYKLRIVAWYAFLFDELPAGIDLGLVSNQKTVCDVTGH